MNKTIVTVLATVVLAGCGGGGDSPPAAANNDPVAIAGSNQMVRSSATTNVTLDGTKSWDPEGDALTFSWALESKPTGSGASLSSSNTSKPTFKADLIGEYIFSLTVSDGKVDSPTAIVQISAYEQPLAGVWGMYPMNSTTLLNDYIIYSTDIVDGVNGWYSLGHNQHPYATFPEWLKGTAVQAGIDNRDGLYYIIDFSAEKGFILEYRFNANYQENTGNSRLVTGCRYRYVSGADKGTCTQFRGVVAGI